MNQRKHKNGGQTISTHEMRFEFQRVLQAVKAGRTLTLTYRSKPLARIVPLKTEPEVPAEDPIFRLDELSEPIGPLTNAEIDEAVYGR
jgi:antitoxin (DNA-binding transcriptional repressor) of toxin-antitoxin stability system